MTADDVDVVRHPRARRTKLAFDPLTGRARLTLPPRASLTRALAWMREQGDWIARQRESLPEAQPFVPGVVLPVDGELLTVEWVENAPRAVTRDGDRLVLGGPRETVPRRIEAWLKRRALALLEADTAHYAALAGVSVAAVAVGDLEEGGDRVRAHVGVDGHGVGERGDLAGSQADPRLRVGLGRRGDVAALGVGDHQQAVLVRRAADGLQRRQAVAAEQLEQGDLRLDGAAVRRDGLDQPLAVALDRSRTPGAAVGEAAEHDVGERRPWVEPDAERAAGDGYAGGEPVAEGRRGGHARHGS